MGEYRSDYYCRTCQGFVEDSESVPEHFLHDVTLSMWLKFCGECNKVIEDKWSYCAWCGRKLGDW